MLNVFAMATGSVSGYLIAVNIKMKRYIIFLLILSGCTSNHYAPNDARMSDTLSSCKLEANHAYFSDKPDLGVAAGAAGVLGGAFGGALVGAATGVVTPDNTMKTSEINPYIENCMKKHGYIGTGS